jgi:phosphohistidine phosphatase
LFNTRDGFSYTVMKHLYLLRHGKSGWENPELNDFQRPLNERGRSDVPVIARYMRDKGYNPDKVLCSTAIRTQETWELAAPELLTGERDVRFSNRLYLAIPDQVISQIRNAGDECDALLVIGHNPGMQESAMAFANSRGTEHYRKIEDVFPSSGLAVLRFDADSWSDVHTGLGNLIDFYSPKDF